MNSIWKATLLLAAVLIVGAGCARAGSPDPDPASKPPVQAGPGQSAGENQVAPPPANKPEPIKETVTLYFADSDLMKMYRVRQDIQGDTKESLPKAALTAWTKGAGKDGLANLVPPGVVVESVTVKDGVATVSFSKELKNANLGSSGEMFLIDQVALIMKQFGCDRTQILVEGKTEESLLGHVSTDKPVKPSDPEKYEWWK